MIMHQASSNLAGLPKYAPISRASEITGLGRSTIYKLAGQGTLRLIKAGGRTLVDVVHALEWLARPAHFRRKLS
jgi:hypothetical protein